MSGTKISGRENKNREQLLAKEILQEFFDDEVVSMMSFQFRILEELYICEWGVSDVKLKVCKELINHSDTFCGLKYNHVKFSVHKMHRLTRWEHKYFCYETNNFVVEFCIGNFRVWPTLTVK